MQKSKMAEQFKMDKHYRHILQKHPKEPHFKFLNSNLAKNVPTLTLSLNIMEDDFVALR